MYRFNATAASHAFISHGGVTVKETAKMDPMNSTAKKRNAHPASLHAKTNDAFRRNIAAIQLTTAETIQMKVNVAPQVRSRARTLGHTFALPATYALMSRSCVIKYEIVPWEMTKILRAVSMNA